MKPQFRRVRYARHVATALPPGRPCTPSGQAALHVCLAFLLMLLGAGNVPAKQPQQGNATPGNGVCARTGAYACYTNHKYGYLLAWPKNLLRAQGESPAGDGQVFSAPDETARLTCWAGFNSVDNTSLPKRFQRAQQEAGLRVTYKHLGKTFFVVSGFMGNDIVYRKTIRDGTVTATFVLTYARTRSAVFNPIVGDIAKSFSIDPEFMYR